MLLEYTLSQTELGVQKEHAARGHPQHGGAAGEPYHHCQAPSPPFALSIYTGTNHLCDNSMLAPAFWFILMYIASKLDQLPPKLQL